MNCRPCESRRFTSAWKALYDELPMGNIAKILPKTGMPSGGQPAPVVGSHKGDEYWRKPTSVIGFALGPVTLETDPYGRCTVTPLGIAFAGIVYALSAPNGPHDIPGIWFRSRQVCALP